MDQSDTLKERDGSADGRPLRLGPHLFVVLEGARLEARGARFDLSEVDEVVVGRGSERASERTVAGGQRRLRLQIPDGYLSTIHARLRRDPEGWLLEDARSTNGSFVGEHRATRVLLEENDLVRVGHTFLVVRSSVPTPPDAEADVDLSSQPVETAFATTIPGLASDYGLLARMARSDLSIVLTGETGSGKELAARAIHRLSGRAAPMVAVNCGAIPGSLVHAHLFGHVKGSFTGAGRDELGVVRAADGGTLLLDEVGELDHAAQVALLRVVQERLVTPVGSTRAFPVDVRFVSATHEPLAALRDAGRFRADLLARLDGFSFRLRPLRERMEDFGTIVASILDARRDGPDAPRLAPDAAYRLLSYPWPGNVRELEQSIRRCCVLSEGGLIKASHLPPHVGVSEGAPGAPSVPRRWSEKESRARRRLLELLTRHDGNVSDVARAMGKARMQVHRWLKRYEIDAAAFRHDD